MRSTPFVIFPPNLVNFSGWRRKDTISSSSAFASSTPTTSVLYIICLYVSCQVADKRQPYSRVRGGGGVGKGRP